MRARPRRPGFATTRWRSTPGRTFATGLALLLGLVAAASPSRAELVRAAVSPFGAEGTGAGELSAAIELELELKEGLVLMPVAPLYESLDVDDLKGIDNESLGFGLETVDLAALLRAEPIDDREGQLLLLVHRGPSGEVVLAQKVRVADALADVEPLAQSLGAALVEAGELPSLSERAIQVVRSEPLPGDPVPAEVKPPPSADGKKKPRASESKAKAGAKDPKKDAAPAGDSEEPFHSFDRLGRVVVGYSPVFLHYSACQPDPVSVSLPFLCQPARGTLTTDTTVYPWGAWLGGAGSLELYPWIPYVGLFLDGSVYRAQVKIQGGEVFNEPSFDVFGGNFSAMIAARGVLTLGVFGIAAGARVGYQLNWALAQEHFVKVKGEEGGIPVTLLPSYASHAPAAGFNGMLEAGDYARASLDLDVIPYALHFEAPTTVGAANSSAIGLHGKLQVDLDLLFGFIVSGAVEAQALSVKTVGEGTRYTRTLEPFGAGEILLTSSRATLGVGFHF